MLFLLHLRHLGNRGLFAVGVFAELHLLWGLLHAEREPSLALVSGLRAEWCTFGLDGFRGFWNRCRDNLVLVGVAHIRQRWIPGKIAHS